MQDNLLEEKVDPKKGFWEKIWKKNKLKKSDTVAVLFLREDGTAQPMEIRVRRGFFEINTKTYHQRRDCTYTIMGKERTPLAIIREWDMTPIGTKVWEDTEMQEKCAKLQDHLMQGIRHAERVRMGENMGGIQMNTKTMVILGIMAIIGISIVMGYV